MDSDERQICEYLKSWQAQFVAAREVARRAGGKRRFRDDPQWAYPVLTRLLEQGLVETDGAGHYRLKAVVEQAKKSKRWVSPHLQRILARSGKDFGEVHELTEEREAKATPPERP
jgi:hypothetical protein